MDEGASAVEGLSAHAAMMLEQGTTGYNIGLLAAGWAMQWSRRYRRWAWVGWAMALAAVCLMTRTRSTARASNAKVLLVQLLFGAGGGTVVGSIGVGVQAAVDTADLPIAISLYGMVEYIGGVLGQATATSIWVNVLPARLNGRLPPDVDVFSAMNNLTYYRALPAAQRTVVNDAYTQTQMVLTVCGICAMSLAGAAMLGLEPLSLQPAPHSASASLVSSPKETRQVEPAGQ